VSGAFHNGDSAPVRPAGSGDSPSGAGDAFAWSGDDPVSRAVRAGTDVVEKAMRRGFGLARDPSAAGWASWAAPWTGAGGAQPPWMGGWTTGQWIDAMTGAYAQWVQWLDAWSSVARSAAGGGEPVAGARTHASGSPASPAGGTAHPAAPLRLTVEVRSARAVCVQLDLLPGADAPFEVNGLLAPAAAGAPPITDVTVALVDGAAVIALGSIDQHPAATYAGAVLAAGRACGTLTVRLT
jgi:hypothetical protein